MKLEVGMYVRTKHGIRKITEIDEDKNYYIDETYINDFVQEINCITDSCIIGNPSFNITDLIEVGDYVNGKKVIDKWEEPDWYGYFIKLDGEKTIPTIRNIETIVTKEEFEQMSYNVGE